MKSETSSKKGNTITTKCIRTICNTHWALCTKDKYMECLANSLDINTFKQYEEHINNTGETRHNKGL